MPPSVPPAATAFAGSSVVLPDCGNIEAVKSVALGCVACKLNETRQHVVFSDGNPQAGLMFIGEGPGAQEDETGIPFVGRAGQLLTKIIESVGLRRQQDTYICNVVKCRPPGNRVPTDVEMQQCYPYLHAQIHVLKPRIIVLVGATALRGVLGNRSPISKVRGQWLETPFPAPNGGTAKAMAIFHPSYLLRNPSPNEGTPKWLTWQDIQAIKRCYDED
ncbi:MAG: uracil-DNA glycosylase [Vampirovibrionales bacterium]